MHSDSNVFNADLDGVDISAELKSEITTYRKLRTLIGHCLDLNHGINNSLAGVMGFAEFILDDEADLPENLRNTINQIVKCAEKIRQRVNVISELKAELADDPDVRAMIEACHKEGHASK